MILKLTNKDTNFYTYMGKFFGSRIIQTETKDRIYDDANKYWYIYLDDNNKAYGFISVCDHVIKNIYSNNDLYLKDLLDTVKKDFSIQPSIVTKIYEHIYKDCGLIVNNLDNYKHFIMIRGDMQ